MHWSFPYLGKSWAAGATGPETFDCWGLVVDVYRSHLKIELPPHTVNPDDVRAVIGEVDRVSKGWQPVSEPAEFDVVTMSRRGAAHHVGLYVDACGGLVLHVSQGQLLSCQSLSQLKTDGFGNIQFYRHGDLLTRKEPL